MAFPTVAATNQGSSNGTSHTINLPASISAGDLLLVFLSVDSGSETATWPDANWIKVFETNGGTVVTSSLVYRIATGSEGASITVTTAGSEYSDHVSWKINAAAWHGTTPPEATTSDVNSSSPNAPSHTASWGSDDNLWIAGILYNDGRTTCSAYPLPDNNLNQQDGSPGGVGVAVCSDELTNATLDPSTFTISSGEDLVVFTAAVRPAAAGGASLTVQDGSHTHSADSPSLAQHYGNLTVNAGEHTHSGDTFALTQHNVLAVQDGEHTHSGDSPTVTYNATLAVQAGEHTHSADSPALTVHNVLVVQAGEHTHSADVPVLAQHNVLVVAAGEHTHTADSPSLSTAGTLTVAAGEHTHTADAPSLTVHIVLVVQDGAHTHTADSFALVQHNALTVADGEHTHTVDAPVLTYHAVGALEVQDGQHSHTADSPALTNHAVLVVADGQHTHTSDSPALTLKFALTVQDGQHTHSGDNVILAVSSLSLTVQSGQHSHSGETFALVFHAVLVVAAGLHTHTADSPVVTYQGIFTPTIYATGWDRRFSTATSYDRDTIFADSWDRYFSTATSEDRPGIATIAGTMYFVDGTVFYGVDDEPLAWVQSAADTNTATSKKRKFSTATSEGRPND